MEHLNGILFHKSGPADKYHNNYQYQGLDFDDLKIL